MVSVELSDTISKVSPYVGGYNLNTYFGGRIYDKPELMRHAGNLDLPFLRYPGGSGSLWYFWDLARPDLPDSVDYLTIKGETFHIGDKIRWGDIPGDDYLSLENSYTLREQLGTEAIHVVNYALARYGRHRDPVAAAAHYAAEWVRHDQGRTRFWEIGNEIYGAWEPSWIIDTSRNLDGQPRQITGTLYAEHCLVFLDSMRAAAAETGAEIRIGATLGFQENRETWDREVLQVLGDRVDFYIVHKYFGNHQDASPTEVFQSIEEFYQHKAHVDGLIGQYCEKEVPLVLTEWNTRYSGRRQNVSCANGMHTLMGYKAIINEGIGLSGKWNLIWGYQDGDTHGLLSNEKDNPSVEGIPGYFPRAPFMYQYYFKKFLGDISVMNRIEKTGGLDVFSSHFTSGETGIVLQNTVAEERRVVVNLEDYRYGERFYWYTLTPYGGTNPFDRKVRVNGFGNDLYDAGGPLQYETIPAKSASPENGIRVVLPPYSTTFILAEGDLLPPAGKATVTFLISSRKEGAVTPLENAIVQAGEKLYITDASGEVQLPAPLDTLEYTLLAHGHDTVSSMLVVEGPVTVRDTLESTPYEVSFEFTDTGSGLPIREGTLTLAGQTQELSAEGKAVFPEVTYGSYELAIRSKPYKENIPLEIYSDTVFRLSLAKSVYHATIRVRDRISGEPVSNANIAIGGASFYPDLDGEAVYSDTFGIYDLRVEADRYHPFRDQVELLNDTLIQVSLLLAFADVKFRLYDGTTPVSNAQVDLNGDIRNTNAIGIANYYDLPTDTTYHYLIAQPDRDSLEGSFLLRQDTTISLNYSGDILDVRIQVVDTWTGDPVPASQVVFDGVFRQSDALGRADYQVPPGTYPWSVTMARYEENRDTVRIRRDTTLQVLLTLQSAIVRFRVSGPEGVIEGATVDLEGSDTQTNSLGIAVFTGIPVGEAYSYSVSNSGYNTHSSRMEVMHDTLVDIKIFMTSLETKAIDFPVVYPSPARSRIYLESPYELKEVRILDLKGVVHDLPWKLQGKRAIAEPGTLTPGIYVLRLLGEGDRIDHVRILIQ